MSNPVGQSACKVCGEIARPGSAVVVDFGAGGRAHKDCIAIAQSSVRTNTAVQVRPQPSPSSNPLVLAES